MSTKTKSILKKKSPSSSAKKTRKNVNINSEKNIELVFNRPFSQSDKKNLWHSKSEQINAMRQSQKEEIEQQGEKGYQGYLEKGKQLEEQTKKHAKKVIDEYNLRKNIPYLAAKKALSRKAAQSLKKFEGDDGLAFLIRKNDKYYSGGRRKHK